MTKKISILLSFALILSMVVLSGCGCANNSATSYEVRLEVWGFDDSDVMAKVISEYQKRNPRVKEITYKKLTINTYETELMDALATGNGPDIFLIHNTWLPKHTDKLASAPIDNLSASKAPILTPKQVQDQFADVVSSDFVSDGKVYALPLSADSLALYYNKDLLNQAGIAAPPATWIDFDSAVKKITHVDSLGNINPSGAAMGMSSDRPDNPGGGKINRATDILTLLVMQSGADMISGQTKQAAFADFTSATYGGQTSPGESALAYYTKFSDPAKAEYSWNSLQHNSKDSFIEGKTAMMINYSWLIPQIQSKAPKLNFGIAKVPQNKDKSGNGVDIDFANYWGYAVSKNKSQNQEFVASAQQNKHTYATDDQRIAEAWKFIRFLTMPQSASADLPVAPAGTESTNFDPAAEYTANLAKPAARRDLIDKQKSDILLAPFVAGNLIAKSWPQPDNLAVENIFDTMIDNVVLKGMKIHDAIGQAQNSVNVLMRK